MPNNLRDAKEADPVRRATSPEALQRIDEQIEEDVRYYSAQSDDAIARRIEELQREWSIERYLQVNVSTIGLVSAVLALTVNKKWALVTCTALGFFLHHATRGWEPPVPILRRLGIRTRGEIDREIYALKAIRGDFKQAPHGDGEPVAPPTREALEAVRA